MDQPCAGPHRVSCRSERRADPACTSTWRTTTRTRGAMTATLNLLRSWTSSAPTSVEAGFTGARRAGRASPRSSTAARSTETVGASSAARCVQSATGAVPWHCSCTTHCATLDHFVWARCVGARDGPAEQVCKPVRHVELGGRGSRGLLRPGRIQLAVPVPRFPIVSKSSPTPPRHQCSSLSLPLSHLSST